MIRDVTRRLGPGFPAWPGDPPFEARPAASFERGGAALVTGLAMSAHTGTHLDAPAHVLRGAPGVESIGLDVLVGPALVIRVEGASSIAPASLPAVLPARVLFRTESAETLPEPPRSYVSLSEEAAARLAAAGVRLVGIDTPSVDEPLSSDLPVHRILARSGAAILEWLDLRDVPAGEHFLIALPLRVERMEASPVRAVLLEVDPRGAR